MNPAHRRSAATTWFDAFLASLEPACVEVHFASDGTRRYSIQDAPGARARAVAEAARLTERTPADHFCAPASVPPLTIA